MNQPIRILHVVTHMNCGGLETMLMNFYRNIDRTKIQFDFLTHRNEKKFYDDEILEYGGKIYHLSPLNPLDKNGYLLELDQFFHEHKEYRIVHSHLDWLSTIPLFYAHKHNIPIRIAHSHSSKQNFDVKYLLRFYIKGKMKNHATHFFACSKKAGQSAFGRGNFLLLNNAIDASKFIYNEEIKQQVKNELKLKEDQFIVLHVGSFGSPKNHMFIVDVFKEIHTIDPRSVLILVGVGRLKEEVVNKVQRLGLINSVLFLDVRNDVDRILQVADVFLFPSLHEGLGIALIEAQAAGVRCFASEKRVPDEAKVTSLLEYISLDKPAEFWAEKVLECGIAYSKPNTYEEIVRSGYDIKVNAKWLQNFYINEMQRL